VTERSVQVGDEIPSWSRATGFEQWNRYAAVNDEFVPIHMDDEAGRAAGYPTAFGMGNLQLAYLYGMLREWLGDDGEIREVSCQFRAPNLKGQTVTARGTVTGVTVDDAGRAVVDLDVWTEDQGGGQLCRGRARVAVPHR
jgi:acyl dehydratase